MMDFMRDGGMNMWVILATTIATVAVALAGGRERRSMTFVVGMCAVMIQGMMGISIGMLAVSKHFGRFPDAAQAIGIGLGELSNNGTFAASVATVFGLAALFTRVPSAAAK
ncbi:MAG: hypothetical protein WCJ30_06855 [Deltaproteobacteria bacterium]